MTGLPRFCGHCGTEWQSETARFCANCGLGRTQPTGLSAPPASREPAYPIAPPRLYRSAATRSGWTRFSLVVVGAALIASFISTIAEIGLLQQIADGGTVTIDDAQSNENRQVAIGGILLIALAATVISFCVWIYRASSNLDELQADNRRFTPGWAVGWWFIPFMNLFRPYQVVKEIWKGSYPIAPGGGAEGGAGSHWLAIQVSPILGWWWGVWLTSGVVNYLVARTLSDDESSVDALITAEYFSLAGDALTLIATVLLFLLVKGITSNQDAKFQSLHDPAAYRLPT